MAFGFPLASVEPVAELIKTRLQIPGRYAVISAQQERFQVADGDMRRRAAIRPPFRAASPVRHDAEICQLPSAKPAHRCAPADWAGGGFARTAPRRPRYGGNLPHGDESGTIAPVLDRHQHCGLALGAASAFAATTPVYQRIVDLDEVVQAIDAVAVSLGRANLAQHPAGGEPGHADSFGKTHGGNPALVRGRQVNCPEPLGQGQVGGMKQRARRERGLVMASGAIAGMARADGVAMIMPATRATKPFRPALSRQRLDAGFFASLPFLPGQQVGFHRFHDATPYLVDHKNFVREN